MSQVRAKFVVESITELPEAQAEGGPRVNSNISLRAVTNGSKENEQFFRWTPSANIQLNVVNPEAAKAFKQGQEFYVDFTPAE